MKKALYTMKIDLVCILVIVSLLGCDLQWSQQVNPAVPNERLLPEVALVIEEQLEIVKPFLDEEFAEYPLARSSEAWYELDSYEMASLALQEENGDSYLALCHQIAYGNNSAQLLEVARPLLTPTQYSELVNEVLDAERAMRSEVLEGCRTLPPNQRAPFMRDLQKLVTKTVVLLVAGIVYACIPNVIFWGKVTAAAAIAVAAGIVATTIMSIYRFYKYDSESLSTSFQEWLVDVTTDPAASYAVAASMTSIGGAMKNGPVVTGLIIAVFAIYQVIDLVTPMLKKYNFNA